MVIVWIQSLISSVLSKSIVELISQFSDKVSMSGAHFSFNLYYMCIEIESSNLKLPSFTCRSKNIITFCLYLFTHGDWTRLFLILFNNESITLQYPTLLRKHNSWWTHCNIYIYYEHCLKLLILKTLLWKFTWNVCWIVISET